MRTSIVAYLLIYVSAYGNSGDKKRNYEFRKRKKIPNYTDLREFGKTFNIKMI